MRPISHKTLLRKSRNFRNEEAILKLAQNDSFKEWSKNTENGKLIRIKKQRVEKLSVGLHNMLRQVLP